MTTLEEYTKKLDILTQSIFDYSGFSDSITAHNFEVMLQTFGCARYLPRKVESMKKYEKIIQVIKDRKEVLRNVRRIFEKDGGNPNMVMLYSNLEAEFESLLAEINKALDEIDE